MDTYCLIFHDQPHYCKLFKNEKISNKDDLINFFIDTICKEYDHPSDYFPDEYEDECQTLGYSLGMEEDDFSCTDENGEPYQDITEENIPKIKEKMVARLEKIDDIVNYINDLLPIGCTDITLIKDNDDVIDFLNEQGLFPQET